MKKKLFAMFLLFSFLILPMNSMAVPDNQVVEDVIRDKVWGFLALAFSTYFVYEGYQHFVGTPASNKNFMSLKFTRTNDERFFWGGLYNLGSIFGFLYALKILRGVNQS